MYPSLFFLVTKVLDVFGRLVYDRIRRRSEVDDRTGRPIQTPWGEHEGREGSPAPGPMGSGFPTLPLKGDWVFPSCCIDPDFIQPGTGFTICLISSILIIADRSKYLGMAFINLRPTVFLSDS